MSDALWRGCVVVRGARYGVVWHVGPESLALLPVLRPDKTFRHDVALEMTELVACGVPIAGAIIRPWLGAVVRRYGHDQVGQVPQPVMDRVMVAVIRRREEAIVHDRWTSDHRHRTNARGRCVNLIG